MKKGFSLIETFIYITILAIVSIFVVQLVLSFGRTFVSLRDQRNAARGAEVALERIVRTVREARNTVSGSVWNTHPGTLVLTNGATTTTFALTSGRITVKENAGAAVPLTPPGLAVSRMIFRSITTATSKVVKIELILGGHNFYSTVVMRGSY